MGATVGIFVGPAVGASVAPASVGPLVIGALVGSELGAVLGVIGASVGSELGAVLGAYVAPGSVGSLRLEETTKYLGGERVNCEQDSHGM